MRNNGMTITATILLLGIGGLVIWRFATTSDLDDLRIVLLFMGVSAFVSALVIKPENFWGKKMRTYSVSMGTRDSPRRKSKEDVMRTKKIMFLLSGACVLFGIIGFLV